MINLKNINFGYSKKWMLFQDLNLELTPGHIYGLLGKNGAGKTTLLKIMSGLCFPQSGVPLIMGLRAEKRYPEVLSNLYFVPEELYTPHLKLANYVKVYAPFYPNFNHQQLEHYLKEFEIDFVDGYIDKLSHGQKKKIHIAFALATNSQVLIMDEPTNGLDIPSKTIFRRIMASVANEDRLIIISTHQVRDLHSLIDSVIVLDNGEIIFNASNDEIINKLVFKIADDQDDSTGNLYEEDSIRGKMVVRENTECEESKLDIELFFNSVIHNKQKIKEIFNPQNKES
ncbi:ABC transporter ATP-binding protein [Bacteroidales bacterium OttesenSCG-928-C03]|nr:ABC transporter ATP-binding protein [Bacteroidales bacterium OttesenSCG-928-C03]MDL2325492.1 ABC transporter ATP-binding protein [Bacteroidales bacterium OttesenSCG-928-A14]